MKWLIASDIHGSAHFCSQLLEAYHREGAQALLLLGDLLYHGPRNPLPPGYAPQEVAAMLNEMRGKIFCVRGNCEAEVDQMMLSFPVLADYALLELGGRRIFATHGHRYNLEGPAPLSPGDVLLHGHTHVPAKIQSPGGWWYLNPGSVSLPKDGSPHAYIIQENSALLWKSLDGGEFDRLEL